MKILGAGDLRNRQDEAIKYALSLGLLDCVHDRRGEPGRAGRFVEEDRGRGLRGDGGCGFFSRVPGGGTPALHVSRVISTLLLGASFDFLQVFEEREPC